MVLQTEPETLEAQYKIVTGEDPPKCGTREPKYSFGPVMDIIGKGSYGEVIVATEKHTGRAVALKRITPDPKRPTHTPSRGLREIKFMRMLDYPNILKLEEVVRSKPRPEERLYGTFYLVLEKMDEDLSKHISRLGHMPMCKVKYIMSQVLDAVAYCHRLGILHLDLKPENVLLKNRGGVLDIKLADFGAAWDTRSDATRDAREVTTHWYRAPERFLGAKHTWANDMWSMGCILAELLFREPLFPGKSEKVQLSRIELLMGTATEDNCPGCSQLPLYQERLKKGGTYPEMDMWKGSILPPETTDLLRKLICLDPNKRLSAEEALQHPFFANVEQVPPPFALNTPPKAEAARNRGAKRKSPIEGCEADQCLPSLERDCVEAKRARSGQDGQKGSNVDMSGGDQDSFGQCAEVMDLTDSPVPAQLPAQAEEPQPPLPSEVWPPLPPGPPPASPAVTQPLSQAGWPAVPPPPGPPGLPAGPPAVPPAQPPAGSPPVPPPRPPPGSPARGAAAAAPAQVPAQRGHLATQSVAGASWPAMVWHHPGYTVAGQQLHYASAWHPHNGTAAQLAYPYSAMYGPALCSASSVAPFHGPQAAGWAYPHPL